MQHDYYKEYYDLERQHWWFVAREKIILNYLKKIIAAKIVTKQDLKILNIGCGPGRSSQYLSSFGEVTSIEYDKECCEFASERTGLQIINGSITNPNTFTDDKSVSGGYYAYLGDVLSHEMGHFLGLGHSEVFGSTMIFSVFKGQHTIHNDDIAGLDHLYSHLNKGGRIFTLGGDHSVTFPIIKGFFNNYFLSMKNSRNNIFFIFMMYK